MNGARIGLENGMKTFGFLLVVAGVLALVYGGLGHGREASILDVRPFQTMAIEQHGIALSPVIGGIALLGGILLLAAPRKRLA
jgi:hypothetical protein